MKLRFLKSYNRVHNILRKTKFKENRHLYPLSPIYNAAEIVQNGGKAHGNHLISLVNGEKGETLRKLRILSLFHFSHNLCTRLSEKSR